MIFVTLRFATAPPSEIIDFDSCLRATPVAALTVHRTVIHYRDCASLTLVRGSLRRYCARGFIDSLTPPEKVVSFFGGEGGI